MFFHLRLSFVAFKSRINMVYVVFLSRFPVNFELTKQGLYLGLNSCVRRCSNASGTLQQICADAPSSWRQLPAMGETFSEKVKAGLNFY